MGQNQWDAKGYSKNARFVSDLGMPVVEWLAPVPGETVLDLGCGDGALTARLSEMGVIVTGMDSSSSMVEAAQRLGLDAMKADMHEFNLGRTFDAVFTNAVLHWTVDINRVLACVRHHLRSGHRFVGEFGGFGNVAAISTAVRASIAIEGCAEKSFKWYFPTVEEFRQKLEEHGFETVRAELIPRPTPVPTGMRAWLETFSRPFVSHLPADAQESILDRAVKLLQASLQDSAGNWTADYVRLRFHATLRPGAQD
ncbi:MAG: class I SAM-dependent methyltransferase [Acidobacteria bacterium]|nr:class I SAM-dependent methyltransferase [Acidobacteriota bacterium]